MRRNSTTRAFVILALFFACGIARPVDAFAATAPSLGAVSTFGVIASTFTNSINTPPQTIINGDVCWTTGPDIPPVTISGVTSSPCAADISLDQANATGILNGQSCTLLGDIIALNAVTIAGFPPGTFPPGCYASTGAIDITATTNVTLDGPGIYVFRPGGVLTTGADSHIVLLNGASASDVFWIPTGAATLGANDSPSSIPTFVGNIFDDAGITMGHFANLRGRALASGGTVTTDSNTITVPAVDAAPVRDHLVFDQEPGSVVYGNAVATTTVKIVDADGNVVTNATDSVAIAIDTNPGNGILSGALTEAAANGIATFNDLKISKAGAGYSLIASSPNLTTVTSTAFDVARKILSGIITASSKTYDGNASAVMTTCALVGVLGPDDVRCTGGTATFDDANVGTNKTVTVTGLDLAGADAGNYSFDGTATALANIDAAPTVGVSGSNGSSGGGVGQSLPSLNPLSISTSSTDTNIFSSSTATETFPFPPSSPTIPPPFAVSPPIPLSLLPAADLIIDIESLDVIYQRLHQIVTTLGLSPPPFVPTSEPPVILRTLFLGSTGLDVNALQDFLITQHTGPAAQALQDHGATQNFGVLTKNALREFQAANSILPASGNFGPQTRAFLNSIP
jgi:hypothetical protein